MSTPNDYPGPEQPGSQPSPGGHGSQPAPDAPQNPSPGDQQPGYQAPPPGYQCAPAPGSQQPPAGYQGAPPPGYQQQPAPGYQGAPPPGYQQQPGYQQPPPGYQQPVPSAGAGFEMPSDWPKNMNGFMPSGGLSGLFKLGGLPQLLKVSYIIWLVTAVVWFLGTFVSFVFSVLFLSPRGVVASIISLALIIVMVVCAMKLKEGRAWARMALSVIAVLSIVLAFVGAGSGLLGIVATVLMWLPESSAWLNARSRGAA